MSDKPKFPRDTALLVAKELCDALAPWCEVKPDGKPWIIVAGSLRRRKEQVGDVELLYVPRIEEKTIESALLVTTSENPTCLALRNPGT